MQPLRFGLNMAIIPWAPTNAQREQEFQPRELEEIKRLMSETDAVAIIPSHLSENREFKNGVAKDVFVMTSQMNQNGKSPQEIRLLTGTDAAEFITLYHHFVPADKRTPHAEVVYIPPGRERKQEYGQTIFWQSIINQMFRHRTDLMFALPPHGNQRSVSDESPRGPRPQPGPVSPRQRQMDELAAAAEIDDQGTRIVDEITGGGR